MATGSALVLRVWRTREKQRELGYRTTNQRVRLLLLQPVDKPPTRVTAKSHSFLFLLWNSIFESRRIARGCSFSLHFS
jgi:hypothetical protein